jgi:hypothetical protein
VDLAAKVIGQIMAGLAGQFVMAELAAALKGQRGAAKRKAATAIGGEIRGHSTLFP